MPRGRIGRLDRVATLVHPGIHAEAVASARAAHELPHADGVGPAHGFVRVPALDQREIAEVSGQTLRLKAGTDHGLVAGAAAQEDLHPAAGQSLEVAEVVLDPRVVGVGEDVDVPAHVARVERGDFGLARRGVGQIVEHDGVGGGALVRERVEIDDGCDGIVDGSRQRRRRGGGRDMASAGRQNNERA